MGKITAETREEFKVRSQIHKDAIDKSLANEKKMLALIAKESEGSAYRKLMLAEDMIYIVTLYININNLSVDILGVKNNDALNDARKILYKAIIYLEDVVTNFVDVQYSDIEEKILEIEKVSLEKRYYLMRKLGLAIRLLIDAFGDNTKWKWSFVEIQGRFSTVMKNLLNWKEANRVYFDSSLENYDTTVFYIRMVKRLLDQSAKEYRDRYELSTHRIDDMRLAINYVLASRRISMLLSEPEEAEELKTKAKVWRDKLDSDQKKGIAS